MADTIERPPIAGAVEIPLGLIKPNRWNRKINEAGLADLAASIRQHQVLQPILVRPIDDATAGQPLYELIAGERRWRGSQLAGLAAIPALVRPMDDLEVIELMLVENLEREDLHPLDEALGYDRLLRKDSGPQCLRGFATVDALAERIGKSRSYVLQRLKLLTLCEQAERAFRANELSFSVALRIARLPDQADQAKATKAAVNGWGGEPMSARAMDDYIEREFMLELRRATFPIASADLVPEAGSCLACPKRTGNAPELFADDTDGDTCTDGACYHAKTDAHAAAVRAEAEAKGMRVISGAEAKKLKPNNYGDAKGLLELEKTHYQIDDKRPLRELLKKADIKPVLFQDPYTHQLVEMVPADQALQALKATGVIKTAKMPGTSAHQRAEDRKRLAENAWRGAVAEACLQAARQDAPGSDYRARLVGRVAVQLWHEMHNDTRVRLSKMLGWPPLKSRWDHGAGITADQHITGLSDGDLCAYLTAAVICVEAHLANHQGINDAKTLLAVAAELGIDAAAIKASQRKLERVTPAGKAKKPTGPTPETALAGALKAAQDRPAKQKRPGGNAKAPAVRYRNAHTGESWTGRGLQPKWLKAALASGKTLADFLTTPPAPAGNPTKEEAHHE